MHTTLTTFAFAILTSAMVCPAPAQANTSAPSQHETEFDKRDDQHLQLVGSLTMLNVSSSQKSLLPDPAVVAKIDLSEQRMRVYLNGLELHSWKVSTARRGYYTPRGNFTPYSHAHHVALTQIPQCAHALFCLLSQRLGHSRHQCHQPLGPPSLSWVRPPAPKQRQSFFRTDQSLRRHARRQGHHHKIERFEDQCRGIFQEKQRHPDCLYEASDGVILKDRYITPTQWFREAWR